MNLSDFKESLRQELFGKTPEGHCVKCKEKFSNENVFSSLGWKETQISGICEKCWDAMFSENEENME
jgi:hypothetical protein